MSTSAVTPNPDDQQTAPPAAQPTMPASPDQGGESPVVSDGPQTQQAPTAPAQPAGSKWGNVVKGALAGFMAGGVAGAVVGAAAPKTAQQGLANKQASAQSKVQQQQAQVRFTDAQAAATQQEAAVRQIQIEQAPEKLQMEIKAADKPQVDAYLAKGIQPAFMSDNNPEAHRAALESYAKANGGSVDSLVTFHYGDKLATFDTSSLAQVPAQLQETNRMLELLGRPTYSNMGQFKAAPAAAQKSAITDTVHLANPAPETDPDKAKSQLFTYQGYLAKAQSLPDDNPNKAKDVADMTAAVAKIKGSPALSGQDTEKTKAAIKIAQSRGAAFNNSKIVPVIDEQGNLTMAKAGDALSRGLAPGVEGAKIGAKQAQLGDIQTGLSKVRDTVGKLSTPFSPAQVTQLNLAINGTDEKTIAANIKALNNQNLTSDQKQFVVDIAQLNERALSLRNIAGQGQGSDALRAAIHRMLPGAASGDREMMTKQLDAMDQQVKVLGAGIPKVKGLPTGGSPSANAAPAAQNFTHLSASGKFGWNGTKWVPTGK